jgi:uncharacterized protein (TIGR02265 family)
MQSSQKSHPDMRVKGGLPRARFLFVALNHGPDAWTRSLARLAEEDRLALAEIDIEKWYPLDLLDRLDRAVAEELGQSDEETFTQLGEFSATTSLSGPFASLLNTDIHSFLSQSSLIHHSYQNFGAAKYDALSDTSGLLTIQYETAPPESFCISGASYFRKAVELCGARSAQVTHARCSARGDAVCEFYITWQK